jgi:hypothetical protein
MRRVAIAFALAAVLVAACSSAPWPKTAGETTCSEWSTEMTSGQRETLGGAMLLALRASHGGTVAPKEPVIKAFVTAIGDTCKQNPDAKISTVGATLYNLSKDLQP